MAKKGKGEGPAAAKAAAAAAAVNASRSKPRLQSRWLVAAGVALLAVSLGSAATLFSGNNQGASSSGKPSSAGMSVGQVKARRQKLGCGNKHADSDCDYYATVGHCELAPGWMAVYCSASCDACELKDPKVRCDAKRIGYEPQNALAPGDLDAMFSKLGDRYPEYNVTYLSRPPEGPWVVQFDNLFSDEEMDTLIDQAGGDMKRSTDQGKFDEDGIQAQVESTSRTSENAWCMNDCERHPIIQRMSQRISEITLTPTGNFEAFQLLRYQKNQEYRRHHDASPDDNKLLAGPRILTFFLYLSDVEEGGGTHFPELKPPLTVQPKRGSAILWPSVLNEDPTKLDYRTFHAALPVIKGVKFAANHWIHQRDYKIPNLHGCTGSFTE